MRASRLRSQFHIGAGQWIVERDSSEYFQSHETGTPVSHARSCEFRRFAQIAVATQPSSLPSARARVEGALVARQNRRLRAACATCSSCCTSERLVGGKAVGHQLLDACLLFGFGLRGSRRRCARQLQAQRLARCLRLARLPATAPGAAAGYRPRLLRALQPAPGPVRERSARARVTFPPGFGLPCRA